MASFLSKVFDNFFDNQKDEMTMNPKYNIEKISYNKFMLTLAVPGYKKNNLKVSFNNGVLTIKGNYEHHNEHNTKDYLYQGFSMKSFQNSFSLSDRLEVVEANLYNGLLHIILKDKFSSKDLISPLDN